MNDIFHGLAPVVGVLASGLVVFCFIVWIIGLVHVHVTDLREWHKWYAWYPVKTKAGMKWLCKVWRRGAWTVPYDPIWTWYYAAEKPLKTTQPGDLVGDGQTHDWGRRGGGPLAIVRRIAC